MHHQKYIFVSVDVEVGGSSVRMNMLIESRPNASFGHCGKVSNELKRQLTTFRQN